LGSRVELTFDSWTGSWRARRSQPAPRFPLRQRTLLILLLTLVLLMVFSIFFRFFLFIFRTMQREGRCLSFSFCTFTLKFLRLHLNFVRGGQTFARISPDYGTVFATELELANTDAAIGSRTPMHWLTHTLTHTLADRQTEFSTTRSARAWPWRAARSVCPKLRTLDGTPRL